MVQQVPWPRAVTLQSSREWASCKVKQFALLRAVPAKIYCICLHIFPYISIGTDSFIVYMNLPLKKLVMSALYLPSVKVVLLLAYPTCIHTQFDIISREHCSPCYTLASGMYFGISGGRGWHYSSLLPKGPNFIYNTQLTLELIQQIKQSSGLYWGNSQFPCEGYSVTCKPRYKLQNK